MGDTVNGDASQLLFVSAEPAAIKVNQWEQYGNSTMMLQINIEYVTENGVTFCRKFTVFSIAVIFI